MVKRCYLSENRLIGFCARTQVTLDSVDKIKELLDTSLNWEYIVDRSKRYGISTLLFLNLQKINSGDSVPEDFLLKLKEDYYINITRNMLHYNELSRILNFFNDVNIEVIVLKGAFLAEVIYRNIGLRSFGDLDLLIKKSDFFQVEILLNHLGYQIHQQNYRSSWHLRWVFEMQGAVEFIHKEKRISLDLHYNIQRPIDPFKIDINNLWENSQSVNINGVDTLALSPEDLLIHLCIHLEKHKTGGKDSLLRIRDICDIGEVFSFYENQIDWDYLVQSSKKYGVHRPVYYTLYLVSKFLRSKSLNEALKSFNKIIMFNSFVNYHPEKTHNSWTYIIKRITTIKGIRNKTRILLLDLFPNKEFMIKRYRIKFTFLHYFFYFIRLLDAFYLGIEYSIHLLANFRREHKL